MIMSDPIADMLTRIRNGILSRKGRVEMPASRIKVNIASILKAEGFIDNFSVDGEGIKQILRIDLRWTGEKQPAIEGLKRVSRPGRRFYVGKEGIPKVRGGQGVAILTTSAGVLTDSAARQRSVGGEVICEVW